MQDNFVKLPSIKNGKWLKFMEKYAIIKQYQTKQEVNSYGNL